MVKPIVRLFELLLRGLSPAAGRRRREVPPLRPVPAARRRLAAFRSAVVFVHGCRSAVGEAHSALLRPYARSEFERWERAEQRQRRRRRRELWLAVHGVDVGPRVIHGMEVS